jgi:hypothetical protein
MSFIKRARRGGETPHDYEIASALTELMSNVGMVPDEGPMTVSQVAGTRRPAYHLLLATPYADTASSLLTELLDRSFSADYPGWLIDAREARALIEAAHRISKAHKK